MTKMQNIKFQDAVNQMKFDITKAINMAIKDFYSKTGSRPDGIKCKFMDASTHIEQSALFTGIEVEFHL